ncbi:MAG: hypothetical protein NTV88_00605 [Candidatus Micrarchaeota archaeon]|nr:hypothetical protein [Candidatus Micrarchaeota archaeon]
MSNSLRKKSLCGQSSLEALIAFSVLLTAIALFTIHAQSINSGFTSSIDASAEQAKLSYTALSLDTACSALPSVYAPQKQGIAMAVGRGAIKASGGIPVSEAVFYGNCIGADDRLTSTGGASADA